jgi:hypothetical protein
LQKVMFHTLSSSLKICKMMDLSKNRAVFTKNPNKTNNGLEHARSSVKTVCS